MLKKRVSLITHRRGMSLADFDAHWSGPHVPIVLELPGIRTYVQHHVVPGQRNEAHPGIDGIAEVVFDAPEDQPSNTHYSAIQKEDELAFVSGVTAMPMLEATHRFAQFSVWLVSMDEVTDLSDLPGSVQHDRRDESQPIMTRPLLLSESPAPISLVSCGFADREAARAAYDSLVDRAGRGLRVVLTESVRIL
jgi:uncharacterized protein (TIGR02118 family)